VGITLDPRVEARIRERVESEPYASADEVIERALTLLDEQDQQLNSLRAKLQIGVDQLDRGEGIPFTVDMLDEIDRDVDERLEYLQAEIQIGIDELDRGEYDEWTPELRARIKRESLVVYRRGEQVSK
jgi:antitoxin ParD1/3/4